MQCVNSGYYKQRGVEMVHFMLPILGLALAGGLWALVQVRHARATGREYPGSCDSCGLSDACSRDSGADPRPPESCRPGPQGLAAPSKSASHAR